MLTGTAPAFAASELVPPAEASIAAGHAAAAGQPLLATTGGFLAVGLLLALIGGLALYRFARQENALIITHKNR